ncbi:right-handed parallel beta-helix repeat-containing protein [Candidatus Woesearchaeota archaeon]|nr:right-handed parallel beta-helix repeat-containing protein [Candidatus Woesearchaeota archaeon]MBT4387395.1 right-handed parallel beta-helix repeat-containing protein [Candidatus Woesearchaeota archaeon]MBT4595772.1 right-handed parallel beta-helix repeat-containing protein [Candidatus Woesearchaeota archaeon]MBT5741379.1 right-handed parallel beta-helix repeat-containing protein [Candidatus Woesearchaeota archaeon]MBT6505939.1 right-handed parallel beta-helix repeat-containing protein [Cand
MRRLKLINLLFIVLIFGLFTGCSNNYEGSFSQAIDVFYIINELGNNFESNQKISNQNVGGKIYQNQTWSGNIIVTEDLIIPKSINVYIKPGTNVQFHSYKGYKNNSLKKSIIVYGTLIADGNQSDMIKFTSNSEIQINGDWSQIKFENSNNNKLNYVILEFGNNVINLINSSANISNSIIRWNNNDGIKSDFSNVIIKNNMIYQNGNDCIHIKESKFSLIENNEIRECATNGLNLEYSNIIINNNLIRNNFNSQILVNNISSNLSNNSILGLNLNCKNSKLNLINNYFNNNITNCNKSILKNELGVGIKTLNFNFSKNDDYFLNYIPGNIVNDKYSYVYPDEDKSRKVEKKIGKNIGIINGIIFNYDTQTIFAVNDNNKLYELNNKNGRIINVWNYSGFDPLGMTYDGLYIWINDIHEKKLYKYTTNGKLIGKINITNKIKRVTGITNDEQFLILSEYNSPFLYRINQDGTFDSKLKLEDDVNGPIVYDRNYFWINCDGICKYDSDGYYVSKINSISEGLTDLALDDNYLWSSQINNFNNDDNKIFKIKILN